MFTTQACWTHTPQHCPFCSRYSKPCGGRQTSCLSPSTCFPGWQGRAAATTHHGAVGVADLGLTADHCRVRMGAAGRLTPARFTQTGGDHGAGLGRVRATRAGELPEYPPPGLAPLGRPGPLGDPRCCCLGGGAPSLHLPDQGARGRHMLQRAQLGETEAGGPRHVQERAEGSGLVHPADAVSAKAGGPTWASATLGCGWWSLESSGLLEVPPGWQGALARPAGPVSGRSWQGRGQAGLGFLCAAGADFCVALTWYKVPLTLQTLQPVQEGTRSLTDPPSRPATQPAAPAPRAADTTRTTARAGWPPSPRQWSPSPVSPRAREPRERLPPPPAVPGAAPCGHSRHSLQFWLGQQAPSSWVRIGREPSGQATGLGQ